MPPQPSSGRRVPAWVSPVVRIAVTAGLMAYAVRGVKWADLRQHFQHATWGWWVAGLAASLGVQAVAGVRWAALARPLGFDRPRRFFVWRFFEGMFFSLCLPSSIGGDVVKAYRIGDSTSRRLLAGCSVLADRLTGLAALGVLAMTALAATKYRLGVAGVAGVAAGLLVGVLAAFWLGLQSIERILALLPEHHPARPLVARLLPYQQRPVLIAKAVAWSFIVQMGGAVVVALMARTLQVDLPLGVWFAIVPLVALLMVLPISIGGFGMRENAMEFLLGEQGVSSDRAVAVALLWGLATVVTGLVGGLLFLLDRGPPTPLPEEG